MEAYAELRALSEAEHVPPWVKSTLLGLSEHQTKLFVTVPDRSSDRSPGFTGARTADRESIRLEPSNFLRELLAACRALEWPKVLVLVHSLSPLEVTPKMIEAGANVLDLDCVQNLAEGWSNRREVVEKIFGAMLQVHRAKQ